MIEKTDYVLQLRISLEAMIRIIYMTTHKHTLFKSRHASSQPSLSAPPYAYQHRVPKSFYTVAK